jgi:hypothetical protein
VSNEQKADRETWELLVQQYRETWGLLVQQYRETGARPIAGDGHAT